MSSFPRLEAPLAAVFLDAGGTLLCEVPTRAAIYAEAARARGIEIDEPAMRGLMYRTHAALPQRAGGHFRYTESWFAHFIERIYVGELRLAPERLAGLRDELIARFADPRTFRLFPGAHELVRDLHARGLVVGVISNWSERLPALLAQLGLAAELDFVLASAIEQCEKPEPEIFLRALARAGVDASRALHAGDGLTRDVHGARALGILPLLVDRSGRAANVDFPRVRDLFELRRWIVERLP